MPEVVFAHERVGTLVVDTGIEETSWSYTLNTAKYPTYGGEVVQILSSFIDSIKMGGEVRTYQKAEQIYNYFMKYFTIATQGPEPNAGVESHYEQRPMTLTYPARGWFFAIQPIAAPGFRYGLEVVVPTWQLEAHIVDQGLNADSLREYVTKEAEKELAQFGKFNLTGELSPVSGDPANNPFISPTSSVTRSEFEHNEKVNFVPITAKEVTEGGHELADYYTSLLPSYLKGHFTDVARVDGSAPVFDRPSTISEPTEPGKDNKLSAEVEETVEGKTKKK